MTINSKLLRKLSGIICFIVAAAIVPCYFVSAIYGETKLLYVYGGFFAVLVVIGFAFFYPVRASVTQIKIREGFFTVTFSWILMALLCTVPFFFSGNFPNFTDALFESESALTTTGMDINIDLSELPNGLIFWRSLISWVGGLGILMFVISILPAIGIGTSNLADAETAGSSIEKYRMRLSENAKLVYLLYLGLSILEFILLLCGGMGVFDAVVNTFGSISNCGITNHPEGITYFGSIYIEVVIAAFCVVGATNFSTLQLILRKKIKVFIKEPEIKIYFLILVLTLLFTEVVLWAQGTYGSLGETIRASFLQVVSFTTTAGYSVTDYNIWPTFTKFLAIIVIFIGGCSASTAGGIKVSRFVVALSLVRRNIYKRLHPNAVFSVKIGDRSIPAASVSNTTVFLIVYFVIFVIGALLLSLDGESIETTIGSALGALTNTGIGFGAAGSGSSHAIFSQGGRLLLTLLMLIGRLEIFSILLLFTPTFWRKNS
jgi:trk system potassium uptake protein TrkH